MVSISLALGLAVPVTGLAAAVTGLAGAQAGATPDPAVTQLVRRISQNEAAAAHHETFYRFLQEERSDRTGQHLWLEAIAETSHGPLRRLVMEDGRPLDAERQREVDQRVQALAADPAALDAANRSRLQDQKQGEAMLALSPEMFLYFDSGKSDGTLQFSFRPNPAYEPKTYQERVMHAMAGTFTVDARTLRLRQLDGALTDEVKFGYGLLGSVQSGRIHFVKQETAQGDYKPAALDLSVNGHILLFHTLGRQQHLERRDFELLPAGESLADTAKVLVGMKAAAAPALRASVAAKSGHAAR